MTKGLQAVIENRYAILFLVVIIIVSLFQFPSVNSKKDNRYSAIYRYETDDIY